MVVDVVNDDWWDLVICSCINSEYIWLVCIASSFLHLTKPKRVLENKCVKDTEMQLVLEENL